MVLHWKLLKGRAAKKWCEFLKVSRYPRAYARARKIWTSPDSIDWTRRYADTTKELIDIVFAKGMFVVVGMNGTVLTSLNGLEWGIQKVETLGYLGGITYGRDNFVAIGIGEIFSSVDGKIWVKRAFTKLGSLSHPIPLKRIAYDEGRFVATGWDLLRGGAFVLTSP